MKTNRGLSQMSDESRMVGWMLRIGAVVIVFAGWDVGSWLWMSVGVGLLLVSSAL